MQILSTYKSVFQQLIRLITSPDEQWKEIDEENSRREILNKFFYPLFFLSLLLIFISKFLVFQEVSILASILEIIFTAVAFLGGFSICKKICQYTAEHFYYIQLSDIQLDKIITYSFTVILTVKTATNILHFSFLAIFALYVVFVLWKACDEILKIPSEGREYFLIINSLSVLCVPLAIEVVLKLFI